MNTTMKDACAPLALTVTVSALLAASARAGDTGACCTSEGACIETTAVECTASGGDFIGPGSKCLPGPSGACCLPDGTCVETTSQATCSGPPVPPLLVANSSFEDDVLDPGDAIGSISGWTTTTPAGTLRPDASTFPGGVPEGVNVAYSNGGTITQVPEDAFAMEPVTLAPLTNYTLEVAVGLALGVTFPGYTIELLVDDVVVARDDGLVQPAAGTFAATSIEFLALPGDPLVGGELSMRLQAPRAGGAPFGIVFDDVALSGSSFAPDSSLVECIELGGAYQGNGTLCADASCSTPGDVDGDGRVGFSDLLSVLASWGPCDGDPRDFATLVIGGLEISSDLEPTIITLDVPNDPAGNIISSFTGVELYELGHTWAGDLTITLEHDGTSVTLLDRPGVPETDFGDAADFVGVGGTGGGDYYHWADDGFIYDQDIYDLEVPIAKTFAPVGGALEDFVGMDKRGVWTLTIIDGADGDDGEIGGFGLRFTNFCITDLTGDGVVGFADLLIVLSNWD